MKEVDIEKLYKQAKEIVVFEQSASASLLQRSLGIGYAKAAMLLDRMEEDKVVGLPNGAKPREVLVKRSPIEEIIYEFDEKNSKKEFEDTDYGCDGMSDECCGNCGGYRFDSYRARKWLEEKLISLKL